MLIMEFRYHQANYINLAKIQISYAQFWENHCSEELKIGIIFSPINHNKHRSLNVVGNICMSIQH